MPLTLIDPLDHLETAVRRLERMAYPQWELRIGDALRVIPTLGKQRYRSIVTSPPYFGKRMYQIPSVIWRGRDDCDHTWSTVVRKGVTGGLNTLKLKIKGETNYQILPDQQQAVCIQCGAWQGQLGLEPTPDLYLEDLCRIYDSCWNALSEDGTLWVVIDDSYAGSGRGPSGITAAVPDQSVRQGFDSPGAIVPAGMKPKDLMGVPYELAVALRSRGWYWRADIIWHKPNGFGNATDDRPTPTYEHVLMFSKSRRYYANPRGLIEPSEDGEGTRVIRNVWSINTQGSDEYHFAAYPERLAAKCIAISTEPGDEVLDPTCGTSRTGLAALAMGRWYTGVDLGPDYIQWSATALGEVGDGSVL